MDVVVNHLHFRDPVTDATVTALGEAAQRIVEAGGLAARVVSVTDTHLILLLDFRSAEDADRVSRDVGGAFMREHVLPLLGRDTDRSIGHVIVSARA
jgi:hypothetical protein